MKIQKTKKEIVIQTFDEFIIQFTGDKYPERFKSLEDAKKRLNECISYAEDSIKEDLKRIKRSKNAIKNITKDLNSLSKLI